MWDAKIEDFWYGEYPIIYFVIRICENLVSNNSLISNSVKVIKI